MKKIVLFFLALLIPSLVLAQDGALTFAPPPSDYSVAFLGNIFGVVDGVLHGTGSQIMGSMFAVFNSAVLALGGIIIIYTLMVSTLNTAQEGQFLGQKWSSIWVPVRTTFGLALLVPKASGYCLMQIFVMWIVVQGVGAADKIWDGALRYLNRGGAIIVAQENPVKAFEIARSSGNAGGAQTILAGQVCMIGLQKKLEAAREAYLKQKEKNSGPCSGAISSDMEKFCNSSVPDFINSVNLVGDRRNYLTNRRALIKESERIRRHNASPENKDDQLEPINVPPTTKELSMPMPYMGRDSFYARLNGICGEIRWNLFSSNFGGLLRGDDFTAASEARVIGLQQMYNDLAMIAQLMVNNDPSFTPQLSDDNSDKNFSPIAIQQFGVPKTADSGSLCDSRDLSACQQWGRSPGTRGSSLFNGVEFTGALSDYDAIMRPTLMFMNQAKQADVLISNRQFITDAKAQGWIMAGSYFFNLVSLNQSAMSSNTIVDRKTGLDKSTFDISNLKSAFQSDKGISEQCKGKYAIVCTLFNKNIADVLDIEYLIEGGSEEVPKVTMPNLASSSLRSAISGKGSSTVYGYTNNASLIYMASQPGASIPTFAHSMDIKIDAKPAKLPTANFPCGAIKIVTMEFCVGKIIGEIVYNFIMVPVYEFFTSMISGLVNQLIFGFFMIPLQGMSAIFRYGMEIIAEPGVNPIVGLANMGTYYINFTGDLWLSIIQLSLFGALSPITTAIVILTTGLAMPFLLAWSGVMMLIGFLTAYYVPLLPYMIFTFGTIAWLMVVVEAMVAAPIVALGITHPEGHEAFGKGESAIMILMNVFLRPSMMIIGYIAAIAISYVGVWILNAGFDNAVSFIKQKKDRSVLDFKVRSTDKGMLSQTLTRGKEHYGEEWDKFSSTVNIDGENVTKFFDSAEKTAAYYTKTRLDPYIPLATGSVETKVGSISGGYSNWAGVFAYFFSILIYTMIYLIIVMRSFELIVTLPDKILRWIGGQQEQMGAETAKWAEEGKGKMQEAGQETTKAEAAVHKQATGYVQKGAAKVKELTSQAEGSMNPQGSVDMKGEEGE